MPRVGGCSPRRGRAGPANVPGRTARKTTSTWTWRTFGVEGSLELIREKLGDGRLHALVDNAGISPKGEDGARLGVLETDYATWLRVFNVGMALLLVASLYPILAENHSA